MHNVDCPYLVRDRMWKTFSFFYNNKPNQSPKMVKQQTHWRKIKSLTDPVYMPKYYQNDFVSSSLIGFNRLFSKNACIYAIPYH